MAPAGTSVLKIAFVFFTIEKHNMKVRKLLADKKRNKNIVKYSTLLKMSQNNVEEIYFSRI